MLSPTVLFGQTRPVEPRTGDDAAPAEPPSTHLTRRHPRARAAMPQRERLYRERLVRSPARHDIAGRPCEALSPCPRGGVARRSLRRRPDQRLHAAGRVLSINRGGVAGAAGFEPAVTGPKPVALPLGYAPTSGATILPRRGGRQPRCRGAQEPGFAEATRKSLRSHGMMLTVAARPWASPAGERKAALAARPLVTITGTPHKGDRGPASVRLPAPRPETC